MPADRNHSANNARPLAPHLAAMRTTKSPVTPKLASSVAPAGTSSSPVVRGDRCDAVATTRLNTTSREEHCTPVKSFLNSNVTPRSSSRKSRVGTSNSSSSTPSLPPSAPPSTTRPASKCDFANKNSLCSPSGNGSAGLGCTSTTKRPKSVIGGACNQQTSVQRPPLSSTYSYTKCEAGTSRASSPMFFHASDAKTPETGFNSKKAATFYFVNREQDTRSPNAVDSPSPQYAYSSAWKPQVKPVHEIPTQGSSKNSAASVPLPPSILPDSNPTVYPTQQPMLPPSSPTKDNIHLSYRKGASQVIRPSMHGRPSALSIIPGHSALDPVNEQFPRELSTETCAARFGHEKSASLSSIDSMSSFKKLRVGPVDPASPSPLQTQSRVVSNTSVANSTASVPTPPKGPLSDVSSSSPHSPDKSTGGQSALQHMNKLASNARRERKVLDLEITNSSLLAINRQLEREMRKQKAELRRFRRMSRGGRFSTGSMDSAAAEVMVVEISMASDDSDASEAENEQEEESLSSSESSFDENAMSPGALAERDARHRHKDERLLRLDLTRHRELLIGSQKMNQSLKRCLGWTEELISEGKKALAYSVGVSDVKFGGRVLETEKHDGASPNKAAQPGGTLLNPSTPPQRPHGNSIQVTGWLAMDGSRQRCRP